MISVSAQSSRHNKKQHPPQSVHPTAISQNIHKYPLLNHQTTKQFLSSGCETPDTSRFDNSKSGDIYLHLM